MTSFRIPYPANGHLADANARLRHPAEHGSWIWHPEKAGNETAILRFSLRFVLEVAVAPVIHVTGDQRFQLRCDGHDVAFGPDRSDMAHWAVQSIQLQLEAGEHTMEAIVWWLGETQVAPPMAQLTWRGGFLVYSEDLPSATLNTGNAAWLVEDLTDAVRLFDQRIPQFFVVGPSHEFEMEGWSNSTKSLAVSVQGPLEESQHGVRRSGWSLTPTRLPEQRRRKWSGGRIRAIRRGWHETAYEASEVKSDPCWDALLEGHPIEIGPDTTLSVLWDLGQYRCGYPLLEIQGGQGSHIEWDWAEALYEAPTSDDVQMGTVKGHRGEILGKSFLGFGDRWKVAGPGVLPFLWWRAGRYVRLRIRTSRKPLQLCDLAILQTGYPLERDGTWHSSDSGWDRLMPLFENAFQCSAHEQWTDSPYYEQLCYVGDARLHALSNYAFFGDDRLSQRSIELFGWSRLGSGLVAERYPSAYRQESLTYAMLWPLMVRDFAYWRDNPIFVKSLLPALRSLLAEIEGLPQQGGLLTSSPGWPYVDWVPEWEQGCGPGAREGDSSIVNLHWVLCLQAAAQIENVQGDPVMASRYDRMAKASMDAVLKRYWDAQRGLLLDTVNCELLSEHAQFFALLTGLLDEEKTHLCLKALREENLVRATIYGSFYLLDALYLHGRDQELHQRLAFWRSLPDQGFTATPEAPEPSRSDAHAWGAHPMWHSAASIAGIRPVAPGFRHVRIAPCPGEIKTISCHVVHPRGRVEATMDFSGENLQGVIVLPDETTGEFLWRGKHLELDPGSNLLTL